MMEVEKPILLEEKKTKFFFDALYKLLFFDGIESNIIPRPSELADSIDPVYMVNYCFI